VLVIGSDNNPATFTNQTGAVYQIQDDSGILSGGQGTITNAGTFTKSAGTGGSYIGVAFNNTGTVSVASGTLVFGSTVWNSGQITVVADGGLAMNGPSVQRVGGSLICAGNLSVSGSFLNSGTFSATGPQKWSSGSSFTNLAGTATFGTDAGVGGVNLQINAAGGSVVFASTQHLAGLTIGTGGMVHITGGGNGHRSVAFTESISDAGSLDLTGNDLVVQGGGSDGLTQLTALVAHGYNNGTWTGTGISSSTASSDTTHLTAIAVILNTTLTSLDGSPVAFNDTLAKYTYYGDTNLDGQVTISDYSLIDNGYLSHLTGWYNGDFNYDGIVNGSDYTLIDNAFNQQGAQLTALIADPTSQIAGVASSTSAVPEPTSLAWVAVGGAVMQGRRRRFCLH
jgi:hypothetical protein